MTQEAKRKHWVRKVQHPRKKRPSFAGATVLLLVVSGLFLQPSCSGRADEKPGSSPPSENTSSTSGLERGGVRGAEGEPSNTPELHPTTSRHSDADYAEHVEGLERKYAGEGYHFLIQKPFVVIGNGSKSEVQRWSNGTVHWAVTHLKKAFFKQDPQTILDIWLFKDESSYEEGALRLTGYDADTPFGFYSPRANALVMNISTGGGTLVHEIVHPFVEANFPECPSWFNEGLGSLFEQCKSVDGEIMGLTNWRLAGLQSALRAGEVPPFKVLCEMDSVEFYERDRGTNYAQARYLCYYLQEKGLLRDYYKTFHGARNSDPSGHASLKEILKRDDIDTFQEEWGEYILGLSF